MRVTMSCWLGKGKSPLGDVVCLPGKGRAGARSVGSWGVRLAPSWLAGWQKTCRVWEMGPSILKQHQNWRAAGKTLGKRQLRGSPQGCPHGTQGAPCSPWSSDAFCRPKSFWGRQRGCDCRAVSASCLLSHRGGCSPACPPLVRGCLILAVSRPCGSVLGVTYTQSGFVGVPRPGPKGEQTWSKRARQPEPPEEGCVPSSPRAHPAAPTPKRGC